MIPDSSFTHSFRLVGHASQKRYNADIKGFDPLTAATFTKAVSTRTQSNWQLAICNWQKKINSDSPAFWRNGRQR